MKAKVQRALSRLERGQIAIVEWKKPRGALGGLDGIRRVMMVCRDARDVADKIDKCDAKDGYSCGFVKCGVDTGALVIMTIDRVISDSVGGVDGG